MYNYVRSPASMYEYIRSNVGEYLGVRVCVARVNSNKENVTNRQNRQSINSAKKSTRAANSMKTRHTDSVSDLSTFFFTAKSTRTVGNRSLKIGEQRAKVMLLLRSA